ncbi:hypothetical protein BH09BAC1_BH09BAC1_06600 [soil metagenome]
MKLLSLGLLLFSAWSLVAQVDADAIEGYWLSDEGDYIVNIYEKQGKYYGKVAWLRDSLDIYGEPIRDVMNDLPHRRSKYVMGMDVLLSFQFDKDYWRSGTIYNYKSGNIYNAKITLSSKGNLELTGYYGILFFLGKTKIWTKVKNKGMYGLK